MSVNAAELNRVLQKAAVIDLSHPLSADVVQWPGSPDWRRRT